MPDTATIDPRLGLCAWSLRPQNPDDLLAILARLGVQSVQFPLGWLLEEQATWGGAIDKLRDHGIAIASGMIGTRGEDYSTLETIKRTGGLVPDEHWDENRKTLADAADLARRLGLDTVSFHAGFIPAEHDTPQGRRMAERLGVAADIFADRGLDLLLETGQETAAALDRLLIELDRSNLGVNFDPANMILYGKGDPIAALKKLLPRIRQVHLKDAISSDQPGVTWGREVPVGEGEVDWSAFVEVLREGGFDGGYLVEREGGELTHREAEIGQAVTLIAPMLE